MKITANDLAIWLGASISIFAAALLFLHLIGYVPGRSQSATVDLQIKQELVDATIACIAAVHEIGQEPDSLGRTANLKTAITLTNKIIVIQKAVNRGIVNNASPEEIARSVKPDIEELRNMIERARQSNPAWEAARLEVIELSNLVRKQ